MPDLYVLRPICAVIPSDREGLSGPIVHIPEHACIRVYRLSPEPGMIEVEWQRTRYVVFEVDLRERAAPIGCAQEQARTQAPPRLP